MKAANSHQSQHTFLGYQKADAAQNRAGIKIWSLAAQRLKPVPGRRVHHDTRPNMWGRDRQHRQQHPLRPSCLGVEAQALGILVTDAPQDLKCLLGRNFLQDLPTCFSEA